MKALITGDAGFLGRHFRWALSDDYDVHGIDIKNGTDCRDFFEFDEEQYDVAIHCAGVVGGREKIDGSPLDLAINLALDAAFFTWAVRHAKRAVYLSSSAVYPVRLQSSSARCIPLPESAVVDGRMEQPDALYGWIKMTGERLAKLAFDAGLRQILVVRPFSGYGTDQDVTYPFRAFVERARRRDDPFAVWGTGEQTRDFIHVDDVVGATLALLNAGYIGPVNLCTGIATSFDKLAHLVTLVAGYDPPLAHSPDKPTGVFWRVGDPDRMLQFYRPQVSLMQGVERAFA